MVALVVLTTEKGEAMPFKLRKIKGEYQVFADGSKEPVLKTVNPDEVNQFFNEEIVGEEGDES